MASSELQQRLVRSTVLVFRMPVPPASKATVAPAQFEPPRGFTFREAQLLPKGIGLLAGSSPEASGEMLLIFERILLPTVEEETPIGDKPKSD